MKIVSEFYLRPESLDPYYPDRKDVYVTEIEARHVDSFNGQKYLWRSVVTQRDYDDLATIPFGLQKIEERQREEAYYKLRKALGELTC